MMSSTKFPVFSTANSSKNRYFQGKTKRLVLAIALVFSPLAIASEPAKEWVLPYQNTNLSFEVRAADLVSRMTLEEKASQMVNAAAQIPHLNVPQYEWWNEALHGVARAGSATVFPQAIGLAATFDPALMFNIATAISDEGRAKYHEFVSRDQRGRYQGLTFWSPNVNIFRDPRWGRGQETYGEDPFLAGVMGVEFVKGLQGDDPKYYKTDATAKHYAVHSGPEEDRHWFDARPTERDLWDTYLPAFQRLVQDGNVASVMGAYNRVNGESASASPRLLIDILRKQWGFQGYVVSDCDSIKDIHEFHKITKTGAESAALGVRNGLELNCGNTYLELVAAVKQGLVTEAEIDDALRRLFYTRFRLGMFDPDDMVPYAQIPYSVNQSVKHDELALQAAEASIVMLKNNGVLPLSKNIKKIAVIGPTADDVMTLLGNYYGTPANPTTILAGIRNAAQGQAEVLYSRGTDLVEGREDPRAATPIESRYLRAKSDATQMGLTGSYYGTTDFSQKPLLTRVDPRVSFRWDRLGPTDELVARGELTHAQAVPSDGFAVRWQGQLLPPVDGEYELHVSADDGVRLSINGEMIVDDWQSQSRMKNRIVKYTFVANQAYDIQLDYYDDVRDAEVRLGWLLPGAKTPFEEAIEMANAADVVIYVGGLTGDVEGEEMSVKYPGFAGGDRTDIALPATQQKMLESLKATGKPVVAVFSGGSALGIEWAQQHLDGILMAWYPGQRGGEAVANILWGKANPSGRLPVTFYRSDEKLPDFSDYSMDNRTYRYFEGKPLYPFGYGLSYSKFDYKKLRLSQTKVAGDDRVKVRVDVKNTSKRAGHEAIQLYVKPIESARNRAIKDLRGVERVFLQPGETKTVEFVLQPDRDLITYDDDAKGYVLDTGKYAIEIGHSSQNIAQSKILEIVR